VRSTASETLIHPLVCSGTAREDDRPVCWLVADYGPLGRRQAAGDVRADASQTTYEDPVDPAGEEEVT
jgi:hypothetical protein